MFHFHSMKEAVKARKVRLEVGRVQVSDGLRNEINPSLTSAPFSVGVNSLGKKCMMAHGSQTETVSSWLFSVFLLQVHFIIKSSFFP